MTETSITGQLSIPAIILLLISAILFVYKNRGRNGSTEMLLGTIIMATHIISIYMIYYHSINNQTIYEEHLETYIALGDFFLNFFPVGLLLFSIGFARMTKLIEFIRSF